MKDNKKSVYAICDNWGRCKIGIAKFPQSRLVGLQTSFSDKLSLVYKTEPMEDARLVERICHRELKDLKIRGEWFKISNDVAITTIKTAIDIVNKGDAQLVLAPKTYKYNRIGFSLSEKEEEFLKEIRANYENKFSTRIPLSELLRILIKEKYSELTHN